MTFLGIGPTELLVIMVVLLMVVGPERLPGLARQAGTWLVRVRDWVQRSPDAAMVLRARQEMQAELDQLRRSLAEVQTVRNEVVDAARQVNTLMQEDVLAPVREASASANQPIVSPSGQPIGAPPEQTIARSSVPGQVAPPAISDAPLEEIADGAEKTELLLPESVQQDRTIEALESPVSVPTIDPRPANELASLRDEVAALASELRWLRSELFRRNVLEANDPLMPSMRAEVQE